MMSFKKIFLAGSLFICSVIYASNVGGGRLGGSGAVSGGASNGGTFLAGNGTVAAPSYAFTNDTGTGLYRVGSGDLGVAVGGVQVMDAVNIGSSLVNLGFGGAANGTSGVPVVYTRALAGNVQYQYGNTNQGSASQATLQIFDGAGANYLTFENWAWNTDSWKGGGSVIESSTNQTQLIIASAGATAFTSFPVGGNSSATERLRLTTTQANLKHGTTLGFDGSSSGTITVQAQAAAGTFNYNLPTGAGTAGQYQISGGGSSSPMLWTSGPSDEITNCSLAASVSSHALTIALKDAGGSDPSATSPCSISFRNATAATGTYSLVSATAATSVVVSNGSALGCTATVNCFLYVFAINNAGSIEIGVMGVSGVLDEGTVQTSTAEGGAGAADSAATLYSTTARSSKAVRLLGRIQVAPAASFAWDNAPTEISNLPFDKAGVVLTSSASTDQAWPTAGNWGDAGSVSLTPGTWDLTLQVMDHTTGASTATLTEIGISSTTGNSQTGLVLGDSYLAATPATSAAFGPNMTIANYRVYVPTNQTWYAKVKCSTSITNMAYVYMFRAVKVR